MRRLAILGVYLLCVAGCRTAAPPPPSSGVSVDVPFVRVRVPDGAERTTVDVGGANVYTGPPGR
jgi:hypothetical protein